MENASDILLHESGVQILAAADANPGSFAPAAVYGSSIHRGMRLLVQAGLTPVEVLAGATSKVAEAFDIEDPGTVAEGKKLFFCLLKADRIKRSRRSQKSSKFG